MEEKAKLIKNQRTVKSFSWNIIFISFLGLVFGLTGVSTYISRLGTPYLDLPSSSVSDLAKFFNPKYYIVQSVITIIISSVLILSSYFVLKYYKKWHTILIYGLIAAGIFLIITPIFTAANFPNLDTTLEIWGSAKIKIVTWLFLISYLMAGYFIIAVLKLSREEVKQLFK